MQPDRETPQTVAAWAKETFGPCGFESAVLRLQEEVIELCRDVSPSWNRAEGELADVAICFYRLAAFKLYTPVFDPRGDEGYWYKPLNPWTVARDMNTEVAELLQNETLWGLRFRRICSQIYWLSKAWGVDLQGAIDQKMKINRNRKWIARGDGTGYHVREEENAD